MSQTWNKYFQKWWKVRIKCFWRRREKIFPCKQSVQVYYEPPTSNISNIHNKVKPRKYPLPQKNIRFPYFKEEGGGKKGHKNSLIFISLLGLWEGGGPRKFGQILYWLFFNVYAFPNFQILSGSHVIGKKMFKEGRSQLELYENNMLC